jgi:hypothetical protein
MPLADLLRLLEESDTPLTSGELADRLGMDSKVVAGMLDWLSRSGHLHLDPTAPAHRTCDLSTCGMAGPCDGCPFAAAPEVGRRFLLARRAGRQAGPPTEKGPQ